MDARATALTLEEIWKERQKLLIQEVMAATSYRAEESTEQKEVVVRLLGGLRQLHGAVHDLVQVRLGRGKAVRSGSAWESRAHTPHPCTQAA
jgi:DNA anti-recombination protein RmuC